MTIRLSLGERVTIGDATSRVTELDLDCLPQVRDALITIAEARQTTTYGELKAVAQLPHAVNGLGRLLSLLREDCNRGDEPGLDALVVTATSGEVGVGHGQGAAAEREKVYRHDWDR